MISRRTLRMMSDLTCSSPTHPLQLSLQIYHPFNRPKQPPPQSPLLNRPKQPPPQSPPLNQPKQPLRSPLLNRLVLQPPLNRLKQRPWSPLDPGKIHDHSVNAIPLQKRSKEITHTVTILSTADSLRGSVGAELISRYTCILFMSSLQIIRFLSIIIIMPEHAE
jgi:hypothetical protein